MWIDLFATSPTHSVCLHLKSVYKWAGDWSCGSSLSFCILLTSLLLFADGIVGFLKKQAGPASVVLKDNADLEKFLADQDASVVGKHLVKETFLKVFLKLFTSNVLHNLKFRVFYITLCSDTIAAFCCWYWILVWLTIPSQDSLLMTRAKNRLSSWGQRAPWGTTTASPTQTLRLSSKAMTLRESE